MTSPPEFPAWPARPRLDSTRTSLVLRTADDPGWKARRPSRAWVGVRRRLPKQYRKRLLRAAAQEILRRAGA